MASQGNVSWDAMFPTDATIKIEEKSTGVIQTVTTQVTNFSDGGGGKDTESIAHFGNAFLVVTKPQEDFEVAFDVSIKDTFWSQMISDSTTVVVGTSAGSFIQSISGGDQNDFKVRIEWVTGSDAYKIIYYNCKGVTFEKDNAADDRLTGTITFKVSPTSAVGSGQKYEMETSDTTDTGIGSILAGSYGAYEETADVLFGYAPGSMV